MQFTNDQLFEILQVSSIDTILKCSTVCDNFYKNATYEFLWKLICNKYIDVRLIKMLYNGSYLDCCSKWYQLCRVKDGLNRMHSVYTPFPNMIWKTIKCPQSLDV